MHLQCVFLVFLDGFTQPVFCFEYFKVESLNQSMVLVLMDEFKLRAFSTFGWIYTRGIYSFWMDLHCVLLVLLDVFKMPVFSAF